MVGFKSTNYSFSFAPEPHYNVVCPAKIDLSDLTKCAELPQGHHNGTKMLHHVKHADPRITLRQQPIVSQLATSSRDVQHYAII